MKKFLSSLLLIILIYAQAAAAPPEVRLSSFTARSFQGGVLLEWRSGFELDNLGYNIYRVKNGQRTLVNAEIIAGSALFAGQGRALYAGRTYVWRDTQGTSDSLYYLETVDLKGEHKTFGPIVTVPGVNDPKQQNSNVLGELSAGNNGDGGTKGTQKEWSSASLMPLSPQSAQGPLEDQFSIAAQPAIKIQVKQDGLYRITQPELVAAGLDPNVDAAYLRLFADGYEQAMIVKSTDGHLAAGDYIEFYGFGMDTLTTDTRIYYLFRGAVQGKRMSGGGVVKPDATDSTNPPPAVSSSSSSQFASPQSFFWGVLPVFASPSNSSASETQQPTAAEPLQAKEPKAQETFAPAPYKEPAAQTPVQAENQTRENRTEAQAQTQTPIETVAQAQEPNASQEQAAAPTEKPSRKKRTSSRRKRANRRAARKHHNHASVSASAATPVFTNKVERKDRLVYFSSLLNGDAENFFGQVLINTPITQTLNIHHLDTTSSEVYLEVALQGVSLQDHRVKVFVNNTEVGQLNYGYHEHSAASIPLSPGVAINGDNAIKFVNVGASGDVNIIDYIRINYPHTFTADNNALRFTARSGQVVSVGGFTTPNIRVLEISDPQNVKEIHPLVTPQSGGAYSIMVEAVDFKVKGRRTFVALPDTQFNHPAAIAPNQPSVWNANTAGADMLIIAHSSFIQSVAPLAQLRASQGLAVSTVDVEDIYDEFSYGAHTPQAIKDFLKYATDHWTKKPRYVLLVGDSSLDPRNYFNRGNFDLVPSRMVDTDYTETVSDEVLADFDGDFVAEIPMGRLPARTAAECDLMISKIVSYTPAAVNQSILFVADEQGTYPYSFEEENDLVAALVPPTITKQFVNRSSGPIDTVRSQLMNGINQGPMIVNYSGHGTLDAWTGGGLFRNPDAYALTNNNHLPFFVTMTCLNGYFEDYAVESISEALLKAPNGGAVAVWSSTGLTVPFGQSLMNKQLYQLLFSDNPPALGDAIKVSKAATPDWDVRKTWVLFGDPSMHLR